MFTQQVLRYFAPLPKCRGITRIFILGVQNIYQMSSRCLKYESTAVVSGAPSASEFSHGICENLKVALVVYISKVALPNCIRCWVDATVYDGDFFVQFENKGRVKNLSCTDGACMRRLGPIVIT